ncbi:MAG TPA: DUF1801 domain-containing protein [Pirellulales bacterium]|nr:DUF1801 domain-containing protein [Pirellulales bacterium]
MKESKATSRAKSASRVSKPRKSAAKAPPKARVKAKPGAKMAGMTEQAASQRIDDRIRSLGDWRGETLAAVRRMIHEAEPEIVEECKWVKPTNPWGVPVWSRAGIVCTGETYKQAVKLTFARGASLKDPQRLFNSSLEGDTRRAIDIREGETLDAKAFKTLIQAAVAENLRTSAAKSKSAPKPSAKDKPDANAKAEVKRAKPARSQKAAKVVLLSGGNPQIAKADGDAPVQAYIAAMPGWKRDVGRRLDALIAQNVPNVCKAVKWNSPFYGIEGQGWFLSFHVFTRYVRATFFRGASLRPLPPGGTPRSKDARWIDIREDDQLDEAQVAAWIKQAAALPGWLS